MRKKVMETVRKGKVEKQNKIEIISYPINFGGIIMADEKDKGRSEGGKKSSDGGRGDPNKASPAEIERYLKGIHFPVKKEDLIAHAKQNKAPSDVLSVLERFDDKKEFNSPIDVSKEVGRVE